MFIKLVKVPLKNTHYVQVVESYRDENHISRHRVIYSYGILEEIIKERPNFLEELKENLKTDSLDVSLNLLKEIDDKLENYGYLIINKVLKQKGLDIIINNLNINNDDKNINFSIYKSLLVLITSKILNIDVLQTKALFNIKDLSIEDILSNLNIIYEYKDTILKELYLFNKKSIDKSDVMCNIVNFYYESDTDLSSIEIEHSITLTLFSDILKQPIYYLIKPHLDIKDNTDYKELIDIARTTLNLDDITLVAKKESLNSSMIEVKFAQNNYYIMGSIISNADHPYSGIASDNYNYKTILNKQVSYKLVTLLRDVFIQTKSGKIFKKTLKEKVILISYVEGGYSINSVLELLIKENLNAYPEDYLFVNSKKELTNGMVFFAISTNDEDLSFYDLINKYQYLHKIEQYYNQSSTKSNLLLEKLPIEQSFFINYLSSLVSISLQRQLNNKYQDYEITKSLNKATIIKIRPDICMVCYSDEIIKELLGFWDISVSKQYYRLEKLRNILKI